MNTVTANGIRFAYLEEGTGPLVLLLHGFPDTAYTWDRTLPVLAQAGFRAVAPFTRGYHPTSIPDPPAYDTDTLAADALALIDALGGPAIVIGHDWGATTAYAAAALSPKTVRRLVTLAVPHPRAVTPTPRLLWKVRHFFALRGKGKAEKLLRDDLVHIDELVHRWSPAWQVPPDETARVKAAFREPGCLDAALGYYRALSPKLPRSARLPIEVPSAVFAGEHDPFLKPAAYEKARKYFTGAYEVVAMPGGHFLHREHPEHFHRELLRVLR